VRIYLASPDWTVPNRPAKIIIRRGTQAYTLPATSFSLPGGERGLFVDLDTPIGKYIQGGETEFDTSDGVPMERVNLDVALMSALAEIGPCQEWEDAQAQAKAKRADIPADPFAPHG
jgi:hypothetical protein